MNKFLSLLGILLLTSCGGGGFDYIAITPTVERTNLYYGYYAVMGDQVAETKNHTNILFESLMEGLEKGVTDMHAANQPTILYLAAQVYVGPAGQRTVSPTAEADLHTLFDRLRQENLLTQVVALYPMDEPDGQVLNADTMHQANLLVRKIAAEYPELVNVKLAVIYSNPYKNLWHTEDYDWLGFDEYSAGAAIFTPNTVTDSDYSQFKSYLTPSQRVILVPGGSYGQDPTPFFNEAENDPQVILLLPFVWFDFNGPGTGIRDNGLAKSYCTVGFTITHPGQPISC